MKKILLASAVFLAVANANAAIISADFRTESDLPDYSQAGAMTRESLNTLAGPGIELGGSATTSNPSNWGGGVVYVDLNPTTNILTLLSQDTWDFQTFTARLSNINFDDTEVISGISLLTNNLTDVGLIPTLSFSDSGVLISYATQEIFNFTGGTATFQISTRVAQSVPEPASMALVSLGLLGLARMRRRS